MIKDLLDEQTELRHFLFIRGFLVTTDNKIESNLYPFYGKWNVHSFGKLQIWTHPSTEFNCVEKEGDICFLIGHAYNPFTMEFHEEDILNRIINHLYDDDFADYLSELTGVFMFGAVKQNTHFLFLVDPSGMQSACVGVVSDNLYCSSHPQLVGDICNLKMDEFVKQLVDYKWYPRVMGGYLPADLTPFSEIKRVVPNQEYFCDIDINDKKIQHKRFYPLKKAVPDDMEYIEIIEQAADILKRNMELVCKKWENPWISLTGGIDSNTTFAAANGNYDKVRTFSYLSAEKEQPDCDAAKIISDKFKVPWKLYRIPKNTDELDKFEEKRAILIHNDGYVSKTPENELRKRIYLQENCQQNMVEVKSWVSETVRAYWYKHFNRKTMPPLSGKLFRNLYKIFICNRKLAHEVDSIFEEYINEYEYKTVPKQYLPADLHYNEVTWGSWGGMNISQMKFCFDITFIYNNRNLLDLLLHVPLEKRISDQHHLDIKKYLNKELHDMNIRVVNLKETKFRATVLNMIFTVNSILPF